MANYQKVSMLIHDGLEDEFLSNGFETQCPFCDGVVHFGLYNSLDFNNIEEDKRNKLATKIHGVKFVEGEVQEFQYKKSPIRLSRNSCSNELHNIFAVFTYNEIQPARYESYLIGLFDGEVI